MHRKIEMAKPNPNQNTLGDIKKRNDTLGKAYDGWTDMVTRIDNLHTGVTPLTVPIKNLVSEQLLVDKDGKDNVKNLDGSKASSAKEIREINAISFVGGGSAIQYSVEQSSEETRWDGKGDMQEEIGGLFTAGDPKLAVLQLEYNFNFKFGGRQVEFSNEGNTKGKASSTAFTLSDPDVGDEFDVQVYRDPVYGSPFFLTKAGRSKFVPILICIFIAQVRSRGQHGPPRGRCAAPCIRRRCPETDSAWRSRRLRGDCHIDFVSLILSDPCAEHSRVQRRRRLCALSRCNQQHWRIVGVRWRSAVDRPLGSEPGIRIVLDFCASVLRSFAVRVRASHHQL